jgi:hypothetical protein
MLAYPPSPDAPVTATCAATYCADLIPAFAFVFRVDATKTSFTIYAADADRYLIGATYLLTVTEPDTLPLHLRPDDWEFLRHCLHTLADHWRDAITEADAGATRPNTPDHAPEPGQLNVEPTPHRYRAIGQAFRDELDRVTQLAATVDRLLARPDTDTLDTDPPETRTPGAGTQDAD